MDNFQFAESLNSQVVRNRSFGDLLDLEGYYPVIEHFDKDGNKKGEYHLKNGITNVGKNYILDAGFNSGTQTSSWYIGLVDNTSYSALAAADTMASHGGWIEFTGYSQSTRVAWTQGAASGQAVTNGTPATFDMTASGTLVGIFIASNSTKSGTTGTLWSTGNFTSTVPVSSGDELKITYALSC